MLQCASSRLVSRIGPEGFEVVSEPCGGSLTLKVAVEDGRLVVHASCARCQTPDAPWLAQLQADPYWVVSTALCEWLDLKGREFERRAF